MNTIKITLKNWKSVERDLRRSGIDKADYDSYGFIQSLVSRAGKKYEFSEGVVEKLISSGLIQPRIGRKI